MIELLFGIVLEAVAAVVQLALKAFWIVIKAFWQFLRWAWEPWGDLWQKFRS